MKDFFSTCDQIANERHTKWKTSFLRSAVRSIEFTKKSDQKKSLHKI